MTNKKTVHIPPMDFDTTSNNKQVNFIILDESHEQAEKITTEQSTTTFEPHHEQASQDTISAQNYQTDDTEAPTKSSHAKMLKNTFFTSMAGAILGCGIFVGGYNMIMPHADDNTSKNSSSLIQQTKNTTDMSKVVSAVTPGVVTVLIGDRMMNLAGNGSGVVYKQENGKIYILTNAHVVSGASSIEVYRNDVGEEYTDKAKVVATDTENDIAVLVIDKATNDYPVTIDFENSDNLQVGQQVIAVGSPYVATFGSSFSGSVTGGIISGLNRQVTTGSSANQYFNSNAEPKYQTYIQTDAAINGGNSGGALLDMNGNLVGINSAKINSADNMGLAIPANKIVEVLQKLKAPLPKVVEELES